MRRWGLLAFGVVLGERRGDRAIGNAHGMLLGSQPILLFCVLGADEGPLPGMEHLFWSPATENPKRDHRNAFVLLVQRC